MCPMSIYVKLQTLSTPLRKDIYIIQCTEDISADTATDSTHTAPEYSDQSILCVCMYKYACL